MKKKKLEKCYVYNIFTTNYRWLVIIGYNLNLSLKLLFDPPITIYHLKLIRNITIFLSLKYLQWKIPMIEQIQWPNPGKPKFSEQQPLVSNFDVYHSEDKSNQPNPALSLCLSNFHPYSTLLKFPRHCQSWEFLDCSADSNLKLAFPS